MTLSRSGKAPRAAARALAHWLGMLHGMLHAMSSLNASCPE